MTLVVESGHLNGQYTRVFEECCKNEHRSIFPIVTFICPAFTPIDGVHFKMSPNLP